MLIWNGLKIFKDIFSLDSVNLKTVAVSGNWIYISDMM